MKNTEFYDIILKMGDTEKLMPDKDDVVDDATIIKLIEKLTDLEERDRDGRTLLLNAVFYQRIAVVKYLIDKSVSITASDKNGYTALHAAVQNADVELIKLLLQNGADINALNKFGASPLFLCRHYFPKEVFEVLLQNGADTSIKNNAGVSIFDAFSAYPEILEILSNSTKTGDG